MKYIIVLIITFGNTMSSIAQNEFVNRPNDNTTGVISSKGSNDAGVYCIDSFTLDYTTDLGEFTFIGFPSNDLPLAPIIDGISFYIYADDNGLPSSNPAFSGEGIVDVPFIPNGSFGFDYVVDDGDNAIFRVNVTSANSNNLVILPAGDYWVSIAVVGPGDSNGDIRWNWQGSMQEIPIEPFLIDGDDIFELGATDWTNIAELIEEPFPSFNMVGTDSGGPLGIEDSGVNPIAIFPNPMTNILNLNVSPGTIVEHVTLIDILGQDTGATMRNNQIDVSSLEAGVYILTMDTNLGSLTRKVIKE